MSKGTIISFFDYTGVMVHPWIENGYDAIIFDIQHEGITKYGNLTRVGADLVNPPIFDFPQNVCFFAAFPPCTNTAVSGAKHFLKKGPRMLAQSLNFWATAEEVAQDLGVPYMIEHPVSTISTYCGPPSYKFHPWEYGGYLSEDDRHPLYPNYIKPQDAYPKETHIWSGNGFVMPPKVPVQIDLGNSVQFQKLGGKSKKTKNIRSATPRGFSRAVFEVNRLDNPKGIADLLDEGTLFQNQKLNES